MGVVLFLNEGDVRRLLDVDELLEALAAAFRSLSDGHASAPPRQAATAPDGLLVAMPGHLPGGGLAAKLVSLFPGNHARGLPSHQALIAVFDERSGSPQAVMGGTHITALRTAAASAVAARCLARESSRMLAILGAGVQGRAHLQTMLRIRDFRDIRIASRTPGHAAVLANDHRRARAVETFEEAVRGADVVCCCTDAPQPILDPRWLSPGAHVSSVGSGHELAEATVRDNRVFVEWRGAAIHAPPAGARELQGVDAASLTEIGEVLSGVRPGRQSDDEITVYKSTGHAVEDIAAANLVYAGARRERAGTAVPLSVGPL